MDTKKNQINITEALVALQNQLYDISARNPFVDVKTDKLWFLDDLNSESTNPKKIFEKQTFFLKEYGLETTLKIGLFIKWKLPNKDQFFCSPLLYKPAIIKRHQKITVNYTAEFNKDESWLVNPIISALFLTNFKFEFQPSYGNIEEVIALLSAHFNTNEQKVLVNDDFSEEQQWELTKKFVIGTFNYKKSVLAKDFDTIIRSPNKNVKQLLGYSNYLINDPVIGSLDWFPLDVSQKEVVSYSVSNSLVVQGPPGTGKSHTIVAMINHFMSLGKKVLFVSEKKSALDVVYQRMGKLKPLVAYFDVEKQPKLSYYKSLKHSYEVAQSFHSPIDPVLDNSRLYKSKVYPNAARKIDELVGTSIAKLESELLRNKVNEGKQHTRSQIPSYQFWKSYLPKLELIEKLAISDWGVQAIGESHFLDFNKAIFSENQPINKIDLKIDELLSNLCKIQEVQAHFNLQLEWDDFTKLCLSASILSMVNQKQIDLLLPETKSYKSFNIWAKKYQLVNHQLNNITNQNRLWKMKPDIAAIEAHELLVDANGIFSRHRYRRSHRLLFKDFQEPVPYNKGYDLLNNLKKEFKLRHQQKEVGLKLKHNLNVLNPETEIDFIFTIRNKMESISHGFYEQILEKENHLELILLLSEQHQTIANINRVKHYLFSGQLPSQINDFKLYIKKIKSEQGCVKLSILEIKTLLDLPLSLLNFIKLNKYSLQTLDKMVIQSGLNETRKYQNYLKDLTGKQLQLDTVDFNKLKSLTYLNIIDRTYETKLDNWKKIDGLCNTPSIKLSEEEKERKRHYRQAKRLAVHEMNKSRQLMPVKDFYEKCSNLLGALQPVWMMNPLAIAERLPLKQDLFDVVIFDESSQIPIEDAIPATFRAKQMIVVGDSHQMPPSHFFSTSTNIVPLLTEAQKYLKTLSLKWHYRSDHPSLIKFSNEQFYDNELKLFPALCEYNPIKFHYFEAGVFNHSINQVEADAIAKRYQVLHQAKETDVAIIAMSKEQEKCIRKAIVKLNLDIPESVQIRNLESVQGIEKKHVLISIGYAKNDKGKLNMNFGPINQEFGANRLNVLFSRAIHQMEIFTSISSVDLGLSENRGVTILSQFLDFADNIKPSMNNKFMDSLSEEIDHFLKTTNACVHYISEQNGMAISGFINYEKQSVLLVNPGLYSDEMIDLPNVLLILQKRFKSIKIVLNNDWILDSEKVKKDLKTYFL